jgi:hypothetical protein
MKTGINISTNTKKATESICDILYAGHESHADQETIRMALNVLAELGKIEHVTISNNLFKGGKYKQPK